MFGMSGKLVAQASKREALVEILLRAAEIVGQMPACRQYMVSEDLADETGIWVVEVWDDKEAHDASLTDGRVRALIAEAMPLIGEAPGSGATFRVVGGHGVEVQ
jgi:quinol monooxygenase YgiN